LKGHDFSRAASLKNQRGFSRWGMSFRDFDFSYSHKPRSAALQGFSVGAIGTVNGSLMKVRRRLAGKEGFAD
jgi:hypothetical protein